MAGLTLDAQEVDRERKVILEEIAMYESEPWDGLEFAVQEQLFPHHAYGRPVLGTRESLARIGAAELASFHRRLYSPHNAVLVVAGDLPPDPVAEIEARFGGLASRETPSEALEKPCGGEGWRRVERRVGEVARLLLAAPTPPAEDPGQGALRLLVTLLTSGRSSRLQRQLVDELQHCVWVSGSLSESPLGGQVSLALEVVPGVEAEKVEEVLWQQLAAMAKEPPSEVEMERARKILLADWIFAHERVHQQALTAGFSLLHFDLEYPQRQLSHALAAKAEDVCQMAAKIFDTAGSGVVGWSLPVEGKR